MTSFEGPTPALPSKVGGDPNRLGDRAEVQYRLAGAGDIEAVYLCAGGKDGYIGRDGRVPPGEEQRVRVIHDLSSEQPH